MTKDAVRVPAELGSHPTGHAAAGVDGASRFDPSRVPLRTPNEIAAGAYALHGREWSPPHPDLHGSVDMGEAVMLAAINMAQREALDAAYRAAWLTEPLPDFPVTGRHDMETFIYGKHCAAANITMLLVERARRDSDTRPKDGDKGTLGSTRE